MKIGLFGKGRLGAAIVEEAGDRLVFNVAREEPPADPVDVAIDASGGAAVEGRVRWALETHTPLVIGTTGWEMPDLAARVGDQIGVVVAPNFSITVALYARMTSLLARFASGRTDRDPYIVEHHHAGKHDAPSGTARMLADVVLNGCPRKTSWTLPPAERPLRPDELSVSAIRAGYTYSSHIVGLDSPGEVMELHHASRSAAPYAQGAIVAAEWLLGVGSTEGPRRGVFGMDAVAKDVLDPIFASE